MQFVWGNQDKRMGLFGGSSILRIRSTTKFRRTTKSRREMKQTKPLEMNFVPTMYMRCISNTLFHPLSSPVVREHDSRYKHNRSPIIGSKRTESLHSAADADSVQRPVSFWKHESYKPSPTNSLRSSNSFGIATSPISIHRDEKQFDFFHDYG